MKRGYYVACAGAEAGFGVVAPSAKEAKRLAIVSGELDAAWIDIRVYWQRHALVDDLPVGLVNPYAGLVRGLYCYIEDAICEECGHSRTLHGYRGQALCAQCIENHEYPMRKNAIIERLKLGPCTGADLPYRVGGMGVRHNNMVCQIKVCGKRNHSNYRCGAFKTVYYLEGDVDAAVNLFIVVNAKPLANLNLTTNSALDAGLPKEMAQKIRAAMQ